MKLTETQKKEIEDQQSQKNTTKRVTSPLGRIRKNTL